MPIPFPPPPPLILPLSFDGDGGGGVRVIPGDCDGDCLGEGIDVRGRDIAPDEEGGLNLIPPPLVGLMDDCLVPLPPSLLPLPSPPPPIKRLPWNNPPTIPMKSPVRSRIFFHTTAAVFLGNTSSHSIHLFIVVVPSRVRIRVCSQGRINLSSDGFP